MRRRRLCATGIITLLLVHPLLAEGPIARSAGREAVRLARESVPILDNWRAVRLLEPGSTIVVTTADATMVGEFVSLDGSAITVARHRATESIAIGDVQMIEKRVRRGSALAAVFGTLGGLWLGSAVAFGIAEGRRCYPSCGLEDLAEWTAIIGVPIAGGYGAWRASSRLTEEVIYLRRSAARP
jgi:hypothetical protein